MKQNHKIIILLLIIMIHGVIMSKDRVVVSKVKKQCDIDRQMKVNRPEGHVSPRWCYSYPESDGCACSFLHPKIGD